MTDILSTIDKIVCVCCALVNLCPVVPQDYVSNSSAFVFVSSLKSGVTSHKKDSTICNSGCFFRRIHSETIVLYVHPS